MELVFYSEKIFKEINRDENISKLHYRLLKLVLNVLMIFSRRVSLLKNARTHSFPDNKYEGKKYLGMKKCQGLSSRDLNHNFLFKILS